MQRRTLLKLMTVSGMLSLATPSMLIASTGSLIRSQFLGFSLEHPVDWTVLTLFDEFERHFSEWKGFDANSYQPLAILSRYREPTSIPNHEINIYPLVSNSYKEHAIGLAEAKTMFQFLAAQRSDMFELNLLVGCDVLPENSFSASWRTRGVDGNQDFLGFYHIVQLDKYPLLLVRCSPRTEDDSEILRILAALRKV